MKIIIAGAGEVGTHLAKMLSQEKQDIILMDPNEERLNFTNSSMEILPMVGNPTSFGTWKKPVSERPTCLSVSRRKKRPMWQLAFWLLN